uniref:Mitochondrial carnitine/acylcarnitine carrier protein n=1 Tax=Globodera rostochiensis TaxID=31243 RepID=A0A914HJC0_GLORO
MSETDAVANFIAGCVGGSCGIFLGHPFDTVKVRLQTMPKPAPGHPPLYSGAFDCFRKLIVREGFFALYKGISAPLVTVSPLFAVFFGTTALGKWLLQKELALGHKLDFFQYFAAGAFAGMFTTALMVPGERIKCILQVQSMDGGVNEKPKYSGLLDVACKLYREGGIRSIYRGTAATLLRDIPSSGLYVAVYELLKDKFSGAEHHKLTPISTMMAGGIAGVANWSEDTHASLKPVNRQFLENGIRDVFREIMHDESARVLFRGFVPVILCAFTTNSVCFTGLELTLWAFRQLAYERKRPFY